MHVAASFFNFLTPKAAAPAKSPRAAELVDALVDITAGTDAGARLSATAKEEIEEIVRVHARECELVNCCFARICS